MAHITIKKEPVRKTKVIPTVVKQQTKLARYESVERSSKYIVDRLFKQATSPPQLATYRNGDGKVIGVVFFVDFKRRGKYKSTKIEGLEMKDKGTERMRVLIKFKDGFRGFDKLMHEDSEVVKRKLVEAILAGNVENIQFGNPDYTKTYTVPMKKPSILVGKGGHGLTNFAYGGIVTEFFMSKSKQEYYAKMTSEQRIKIARKISAITGSQIDPFDSLSLYVGAVAAQRKMGMTDRNVSYGCDGLWGPRTDKKFRYSSFRKQYRENEEQRLRQDREFAEMFAAVDRARRDK